MLGSLGDLTFCVSSNKIFTYKDLNIKSNIRFAEHESLQSKPTLEFIGEGLDEVSLKFDLRIENNVNPIAEFNRLKEKMKKAEELLFFIGDKKIGRFIITDLNAEYRRIDNKGNILAMGLDVNLKETDTNVKYIKKPVKADLTQSVKDITKLVVKKEVIKRPILGSLGVSLSPIIYAAKKIYKNGGSNR